MDTKVFIVEGAKCLNKMACNPHPKSVRLKNETIDNKLIIDEQLTIKRLVVHKKINPHLKNNSSNNNIDKKYIGSECNFARFKNMSCRNVAFMFYLLLSHWLLVGVHSAIKNTSDNSDLRIISNKKLIHDGNLNKTEALKDLSSNYYSSNKNIKDSDKTDYFLEQSNNYQYNTVHESDLIGNRKIEDDVYFDSVKNRNIKNKKIILQDIKQSNYNELSDNFEINSERVIKDNLERDSVISQLNKFRELEDNKELRKSVKIRSIEPESNDVDSDTTDMPFFVKDITVNLRPATPFSFRGKVVKLAVILPKDSTHEFSLRKILPMIELASKAVTEPQKGFLPGWEIQVDYRDSKCSSIYGPLAAFEFYVNGTADAFIGPGCEYVIAPVARYAGAWKIPVITAGAQAEAFQHKSENFPTLTRMMGSYSMVGIAVKHILEGFGWDACGMLYHNHGGSSAKGNSLCYLTLAAVHTVLNGAANNIPVKSFDQDKSTREEYIDILRNMSKNARIVVVCANPLTVREIMLAAEELNMVSSGEYVFFNIELFSSLSSPSSLEPWRVEGDPHERNMRAKRAYTAMLTVTTRTPDDDEYLEFSAKVKHLAYTKYNYTFGNESVSTFVTAFYDAVLLYALALNETLQNNSAMGMASLDGSEIIRRMWGRTFKGITGDVTIDSNGDRIASYSLLDMDPESGKFEVVANYIAANRSLEYVPGRPIYWAGGRTEPPLDTPVCGFDGSLCPDKSLPGYAILSIVLSAILIILGILSVIGYRHYKINADVAMMTWKVSWNEINFSPPGGKQRGSMYSLARRGSQVTIYSDDNFSLAGERQTFVEWGFLKGAKVAIKKINKTQVDLNKTLMFDLKKMKDLQHDHLVRFYGACLESPNSCLLTEYCPKGSLQDILENDQLSLDWMFKVSLMHDIARGMAYLHGTEIKSHGALKSSNCVVDSRFVLKITDFGLHVLRSNSSEEPEDKETYSYWRRQLWTAPELLRMDSPPIEGSQKADVYSFGIIAHEIVSRQGVYWLGSDTPPPKDIVCQVKMGPSPNSFTSVQNLAFGIAFQKFDPLRPLIVNEACESEQVAGLMRRCWAEDPADRPDFGALKTSIRKLNKEHETGNIVDNLLSRMEQYANNLESQVQLRTADYLEEKKKCENLLYQLLPKSVAAQLIRGSSVVAETYDQVTIYFSDIVGFTNLSAQSTPLEVVDLLNDLYTCFDSIIEHFDVYKVETIGDAYMVVSGLPTRNDNLHAREVARMSLALLENVHKFVIRHRPTDQLKLRIGIHSGPCVAGVVGLKMPRYCLFGDTVNTASRMESNGEALRIHVSPATKLILDSFGTFDLECRGEVTMKGKGSMVTYWLNGEKPDPNAIPVDVLHQKLNCLGIESGNQLSLTPFRQRKENYSKPSSRRGSGCFLPAQKSYDSNKKEPENQPLLVNINNSNSAQLITNGITRQDCHSSSHSLANNIDSVKLPNSTQVRNNSVMSRAKDTMVAQANPPIMSSGLKLGNNNWLAKIASPEEIELDGNKKSSNALDFSSSVPLLARSQDSGDSIV